MDFAALHDGAVRNNVGVDGILFRARGRIDGSEFVLPNTGQRFAVDGLPASLPKPAEDFWHSFAVSGWLAGEETRLRWLPPEPGPGPGEAESGR